MQLGLVFRPSTRSTELSLAQATSFKLLRGASSASAGSGASTCSDASDVSPSELWTSSSNEGNFLTS